MKNNFELGMCELAFELNPHGYVDLGLKTKYDAYFAGIFKIKVVRIWVKLHELFVVKENDEVEFVPEGLLALHNYLSEMHKVGVEKFLFLDWGFIYPYGYNCNDYWVVPDPVSKPQIYKRFLLLQQRAHFEIARNFTDIEYFESTNEPDGLQCTFLHKNGYATSEDKTPFLYTWNEIEGIVLDLNYYTTLGIKRANKDCKCLLPSFMNFDHAPKYLDEIYTKIESGKYPSLGLKSNRISDFFEILNWHPYNLKKVDLDDEWLEGQLKIYDVVKKHNDDGRKVWYTEIGWSDLGRQNEKLEIGQRYISLFKHIEDNLPFVEKAFIFRLFNLSNRIENEGEDNFGIFYNEYDWYRPLTPKPAAIDIYKYINGENASLSPLYKLSPCKECELFPYQMKGDNNANYKVLIIGNHITYQKPAPWFDFIEGRGFGSSSKVNDYAHILINELRNRYKSVQYCLVDARTWETNFKNPLLYSELTQFKNMKPDLLIVRLGENIGYCSLKDDPFDKHLIKLIDYLKQDKTKVVLTNQFYGYKEVNELIEKVAIEQKYTFVDISNLDKKQYLYSNPYPNKEYIKSPNDTAMRIIAERIIEKL